MTPLAAAATEDAGVFAEDQDAALDAVLYDSDAASDMKWLWHIYLTCQRMSTSCRGMSTLLSAAVQWALTARPGVGCVTHLLTALRLDTTCVTLQSHMQC